MRQRALRDLEDDDRDHRGADPDLVRRCSTRRGARPLNASMRMSGLPQQRVGPAGEAREHTGETAPRGIRGVAR
jgi:hypothetical protein